MDFSNAIPSNTNSNSGGGIDDFDTVVAASEFAPVPAGVYLARILIGEFTTTKRGDDAYRLRFVVTEGEHKGQTLIRTLTFGAKAKPYTKAALAPFGVTTKAKLLSPFPEPGREYLVRLVIALQKGDDGIERNDIKRIDLLRVEESPAAAFMLPPLSEGGPK